MADRQVRLVTINTAKGDAPYARRMVLLAEGLKALNPDVVLLQEAFVSHGDPSADTAATLGAALGMHVTYAPARLKLRDADGGPAMSESGMAVLSKQQPAESEAVPLPNDPEDGERVAQVCRFSIGRHSLVVANVHFTYLRDQHALRRAQLCTVLGHPWYQQAGVVGLVAGDFNTPLSDLAALTRDLEALDLRDAYVLGGGAMPRETAPAAKLPQQGRCIDYLLAVERPGQPGLRFTGAQVVLATAGTDGAYASDHRGVMVTLALPEA